MTVIEQAQAIREAMDVAGATLTEEQALVCVRIYRAYEVGKAYKKDEFFTYGVNSVGDPQLYKVVKDHTSQADWKPDVERSLYTPIGLDDSGYPVWAQPTGAHDAYNKGDIVNYNGTLYESVIDGNIWAPDAYPAGWVVYTES
jgi:hypothetical protein